MALTGCAVAVLALATAPGHLHAQLQTAEERGGCSLGTEVGRIRVVRAAALRRYRSDSVFAQALPGDEFPVCRHQGTWEVVTVWSRHTGFRIPRSAIVAIKQPTSHRLSTNAENCLAADIRKATEGVDGEESIRRLLRLAQRRHLTISEVADVAVESKHRDYGPCRR